LFSDKRTSANLQRVRSAVGDVNAVDEWQQVIAQHADVVGGIDTRPLLDKLAG